MTIQKQQLKFQMQQLSDRLVALPEPSTSDEYEVLHGYKMELGDLTASYNAECLGVQCCEDIGLRNRLNVQLAKLLKQPRPAIRRLELSIRELKQHIETCKLQLSSASMNDQFALEM